MSGADTILRRVNRFSTGSALGELGTCGPSSVTDSVGMVVYPPELILPILIHEFNHSFINFDPEMFRTSGEQIYAAVGEQMARQAYGQWSIVLTEAMVRAAVIKYMKDHNFPAVEITKETVIQKTRGFVWISKLVDELEKYSSDRTTYQIGRAHV